MNNIAPLEEDIKLALGDSDDFLVPTGIMRYDHKQTHGWWVRIQRDQASFKKFFSDSVHGSPEEALAEALKHRHEILDAFGFETSFIHARTLPAEPTERIHRKKDKPKEGGAPYEYWMAVWHDEQHRRKTKSFSIRKFGEVGAKSLALEAAKKFHNTTPKITRSSAYSQSQEWKRLSRVEVAHLSQQFIPYTTHRETDEQEPLLSTDPFGHEGDRFFQLHLAIERDRKLRESKLRDHLQKHGRLFCEICNFNFRDTYPFLTIDIIQVHHITPLSELTSETVTRLSDLMLLCANCHFVVHQGDPVEYAVLAMDQFGCDR